VRFWDTSALVPLVVDELSTRQMAALLSDDPTITVWICTSVELASAVWRRARSHDRLSQGDAEALISALESIWIAIDETRAIVDRARHLLTKHRLRGMDALQLAAALVASGDNPRILPVVTLDHDLARAARAEGFTVLP
jgi:predicted nucleic acid-binding protein